MLKLKSLTNHLLAASTLLAVTNHQLQANEQEKEQLKAKLLFLNGDSLTANLIKWDADRISIKHPYLLEEYEILNQNLIEVQLINDPSLEPKASKDDDQNSTTVLIKPRFKASNKHDTIRGSLVQNDGESITLNTHYAGKLKIQRSKVLNIDIDTNSNLIYHGPNSIEEWKNNLHNNSWSYSNSALYSNDTPGNISNDMKLPDQVRFSFDHQWQNSPYLEIKLFSDDHEMTNPNNYYEFKISRGSIFVKKITDRRSITLQGQLQNFQILDDVKQNLTREKNAHYDLYIDKTKGLIHFFFNGELINSYQDRDPRPEKLGTSVHLVSASNTPGKIRNIKVSRWSGNMPSKDDLDTFKKLKGDGQRILLKNGDAIIGKTGAIEKGLMKIDTEYGPLKLRVSGMRTIDLSDTEEDSPKMLKGDIKLHYNEGDWIIVNPISLQGSKLTAFHQAFGEKVFNLRAFKQIDFHVYKEKHNRARKNDSW